MARSLVLPRSQQDVVFELLKEANMLGALRYPNIVWVYGICLPPLELTQIDSLAARLPPGMGIDAVKLATCAANRWGCR